MHRQDSGAQTRGRRRRQELWALELPVVAAAAAAADAEWRGMTCSQDVFGSKLRASGVLFKHDFAKSVAEKMFAFFADDLNLN